MTAEDGKVEIHPKSVNSIDNFYKSPLLLYHTKLKTTSIYLHDTTMVYPLPVVLFAKTLKITGEKTDHVTLSLNPQINFTCSSRSASFIKVNIITNILFNIIFFCIILYLYYQISL